jgi:hypothetical protein
MTDSVADQLMVFTSSFVTSTFGATVLISLTGIAWAVTQWAPFSLVRRLPRYGDFLPIVNYLAR